MAQSSSILKIDRNQKLKIAVCTSASCIAGDKQGLNGLESLKKRINDAYCKFKDSKDLLIFPELFVGNHDNPDWQNKKWACDMAEFLADLTLDNHAAVLMGMPWNPYMDMHVARDYLAASNKSKMDQIASNIEKANNIDEKKNIKVVINFLTRTCVLMGDCYSTVSSNEKVDALIGQYIGQSIDGLIKLSSKIENYCISDSQSFDRDKDSEIVIDVIDSMERSLMTLAESYKGAKDVHNTLSAMIKEVILNLHHTLDIIDPPEFHCTDVYMRPVFDFEEIMSSVCLFEKGKMTNAFFKRSRDLLDKLVSSNKMRIASKDQLLRFRGFRLGIFFLDDLIMQNNLPEVDFSIVLGALPLIIDSKSIPKENGSVDCFNVAGGIGKVARPALSKMNSHYLIANKGSIESNLLFSGECIWGFKDIDVNYVSPFSDKDLELTLDVEKGSIIHENKYELENLSSNRFGNSVYALTYSAINRFMQDYMNKHGFEKVILGLSGGIDSALTFVLSALSIKSDNVIPFFLRSKYSSDKSFELSSKLCSAFGVKLNEFSIISMYQSMIDLLSIEEHSIAEQNLQSRIRGLILMSISNITGGLLLATGNRSEKELGYCTLYGDTCGGLALISDLYKTEVYKLSEWIYENVLDTQEQKDAFENIINRVPTAELSYNQSDEEDLGFSYKVADEILSNLESYVSGNRNSNHFESVLKRKMKNEYKSRQMPIYPRLRQ